MAAAAEVEDGERQLDAAVAECICVVAEDRVLARVLDPRAAGVDAQLLNAGRDAATLLDQLDQLRVERVDTHAAIVNGRDVGSDDVAHVGSGRSGGCRSNKKA